MPADNSPDKLSLVVFSGAFDRVHYALTMASAALAVNTPATLFFTMGAIKALLRNDGWRILLPTEDGIAPGAADAKLAERRLAGFEETLQSCIALGAQFMVCEMGMRAMGFAADDLRADVPLTTGGLITFLNDTSRTGALVFV